MLKFRPIAPKPTVGELFTGSLQLQDKPLHAFKKRTKRKYVRSANARNTHRKRNTRTTTRVNKARNQDNNYTTFTTLQLLPDKSDEENSSTSIVTSDYYNNVQQNHYDHQATWMNFDRVMKPPVPLLDRTVVESWLMVDHMTTTDRCVEAEMLGDTTDIERIWNLETSSCPCFISNGRCNDKVEWVNEAYRDMINGHIGERREVFVCLVIINDDQLFPYHMYPAFTCRVSIRYSCGTKKGSFVLPCDAWRMDGGDFGWKLDVDAALSLSR